MKETVVHSEAKQVATPIALPVLLKVNKDDCTGRPVRSKPKRSRTTRKAVTPLIQATSKDLQLPAGFFGPVEQDWSNGESQCPLFSLLRLRLTFTLLMTDHASPKQKCRVLCTYPGCDTSFARKYDMTRHLGVHKSDSGVRCELCNTHFSRKDALKRHVKGSETHKHRQHLLPLSRIQI